MQKIFTRVKLLVIVFTLFSFHTVSVFAQSNQEIITSFSSIIQVNLDSSVDVDEVIKYTTGGIEKHGIYRDIRPFSSTGGKMKITNISVTDENSNRHTFVTSTVGGNLRIKIGDATRTFSGPRTYHIKYHASNAVAHLQDFDEIYWNVTGNEWPFSIATVEAKVILPEGITQQQNACYLGFSGSKERCGEAKEEVTGTYTFTSPRVLSSGEGITVAVGFSKEVVAPYKESFIDVYGAMIGAIALVLAVFALIFTYWFKNWRDPKGTGIIVPQYDVPEGLTPMEVDAIVNERVVPDAISAEIIYLATKGYIKIRQIENETFKFFKSTDYEIIYLNFDRKELNVWGEQLLTAIFTTLDTESARYLGTTKLSTLSNKFYSRIPPIKSSICKSLLSKQYYKNLGRIKDNKGITMINTTFIVLFFQIIIIFPNIILSIIDEGYLSLSVIVSIVIFVIFWRFSPAKTEKGVAMKEYLLGLKMYLQIAEKDRLDFHNAPEKNPEIFEKLLPYAMVLGVEKAWAKEFEGIYRGQPSWYEGDQKSNTSALLFVTSLNDFNSLSSSSLSSSPSSSSGSSSGGSSGGGSSGGGGGGGGGGSW